MNIHNCYPQNINIMNYKIKRISHKNKIKNNLLPQKELENTNIFFFPNSRNNSSSTREILPIKLSSSQELTKKSKCIQSNRINLNKYNIYNSLKEKEKNHNSNFIFPFSRNISFIELFEKRIDRMKSVNQRNTHLFSKSNFSIIHLSNKNEKKIIKEVERLEYNHKFIHLKKNKNYSNGEINDDIRTRFNLYPIENSYGKKLEKIANNINFIQGTTNFICPKITRTNYVLDTLHRKKNQMLKEHYSVNISDDLLSKLYKYKTIKRTINLYSKYPIRINKLNLTFYKRREKPIIYNEFNNKYKYNDLLI